MTENSTAQKWNEKIMAADTFCIVNERTGEVVSRSNEKVQTVFGQSVKTQIEHARLFVKELVRLAQLGLRGRDYDVLMVCIAFSRFENEVDITGNKIAEILQMQPQNVNECLRRLIEKGVLYKRVSSGSKAAYLVSGQYLWKGSEKSRLKEMRRFKMQCLEEASEGFFNSGS